MKILCNGCSFTYGDGFPDHEREIFSYPGLLSQMIPAEVVNVAVPGSSNLEIFLRTIRETQNQYFDWIIVQWSGLRRHWFEPCLGYVYRTVDAVESHWEHGLYLSKKDRKIFNDHLTMISGDYKSLSDLACFCQALKHQFGDRIIFINGFIDSLNELATPTQSQNLSSCFSDFSKSVLEFDNKPDDDIKKYHQKLVELFSPTVDRWVNLNSSWKKNQVDYAADGHHPGPKSHKWVADSLISILT